MQEEHEECLSIFYDKLVSAIMDKKWKNKSIFINLLDVKSNDRYRLIRESSIKDPKFSKSILIHLLENNLICESDEINTYLITGKGIWEIEKDRNYINERYLLEYLNSKFFEIASTSKPLNDREKVILFAMIAARTFSEKSPVDLKKDVYCMNTWKKILDTSCDLLIRLKIIKKLDSTTLYGKEGNEHPVSNLIRHTDALPKKTRGIYKAIRDQKYFLDIYQNDEISTEKLSYLFNLILGKSLELNQVEDILPFLNKIAYGSDIYLFEVDQHIFSDSKYELSIIQALKEGILQN